MKFAVLSARIEVVGDPDLGQQVRVQFPAEKLYGRLREIHRHDEAMVSPFDNLVQQLDRRVAPQQLYVLQTGAGHTFLIPGPDISEMNVAKDLAVTPSCLDVL